MNAAISPEAAIIPSSPDLPTRDPEDEGRPTLWFRTIFISDVHLGTPGCQAAHLLDFLRHTESQELYLVGDIIDGWQLKRRWFWHQTHNDVVQKVLRKARKGTRVTYIAGNHDEAMRHFLGLAFGGIDIRDEAEHITADGRRMLVTHGDLFDAVVKGAKWLAHVGRRALHVFAQAQPLVQSRTRAARTAVLVARAVPETPCQERGRASSPISRRRSRTRRGAADSTA